MSKAQFDIYRQKNLKLANTIVVKSSATANALNKAMSVAGYVVNDADPRTWKYYMNLNGQYHESDTLMTVTSLDTLQTIDFTRANLAIHLATAREYGFGSTYYNALVDRYPNQEQLIRCILNPIDIDTAIGAEDGTILFYDPTLVEENETNLIPQLNDWSVLFMRRWNIGAYTETDDLYAAAQLATMFAGLVLEIENIRLSNCFTIYVHSFHMREFLSSHGKLERYLDALNRKQLLWLYRNIRYLIRNLGKKETFDTLLQHILTDRGFPLAEWTMEHNTRDMLDEIEPDVEFARRSLNQSGIESGADTRTITEMLDKESGLTRGNSRNLTDAVTETTRLMENSLSNRLSTKVLESSILDLTDAYPYTLPDTLLWHWLYMSSKGRYKAVLTVDNPKTGGSITLNPKDAFIAFIYAYNKSIGVELTEIPVLQALMIRKNPLPSKAEVKSLIEPSVVDDTLIDAIFSNLHQIPNQYISTEAFYNSVKSIYDNIMYHRKLWATRDDYRVKGQVRVAALHLYGDYTVDLGAGMSYTEWFHEMGLSLDEFSELEAGLLATYLLNKATGQDLKISMSLRDIQASMLALMAQLSSYSVQYLQTINKYPIKVIDWPMVWPTEPLVKGHANTKASVINVRPLNLKSHGHHLTYVDLINIGNEFTLNTHGHHHDSVDVEVGFENGGRPVTKSKYLIPSLSVIRSVDNKRDVSDVQDHDTNYYVPLDRTDLAEAFLGLVSPHYHLSEDDRETLTNRWNSWKSTHPTEP